jgi:hypothetical protein
MFTSMHTKSTKMTPICTPETVVSYSLTICSIFGWKTTGSLQGSNAEWHCCVESSQILGSDFSLVLNYSVSKTSDVCWWVGAQFTHDATPNGLYNVHVRTVGWPFLLLKALLFQPIDGVSGCMWWSIVLLEDKVVIWTTKNLNS